MANVEKMPKALVELKLGQLGAIVGMSPDDTTSSLNTDLGKLLDRDVRVRLIGRVKFFLWSELKDDGYQSRADKVLQRRPLILTKISDYTK